MYSVLPFNLILKGLLVPHCPIIVHPYSNEYSKFTFLGVSSFYVLLPSAYILDSACDKFSPRFCKHLFLVAINCLLNVFYLIANLLLLPR